MRRRDEDLNWFPRPTALCQFRSWRAPNRFKQMQEERCCSNTRIVTINDDPPLQVIVLIMKSLKTFILKLRKEDLGLYTVATWKMVFPSDSKTRSGIGHEHSGVS
ncbi:hypothetical protein ACFX12_026481 [Malus domestica]